MRAFAIKSPKSLKTRTMSPSRIPRSRASSGFRYTTGMPRFSRSMYLTSRQVEWMFQRPCGVFHRNGYFSTSKGGL